VRALAFGQGGKLLASAGEDGAVRLWNAPTGKELGHLAGHRDGANALAMTPDGKTLASSGSDFKVRLWDTSTAKEKGVFDGFQVVALSADGKTLAAQVNDNKITIWDLASGKPLHTLAGHKRPISALAFSPDGRTLASGAGDGSVLFWEVATGKQKAALKGHKDVISYLAFTPDGSAVATGSYDGTVRLWDAATTKEKAFFANFNWPITVVAFSPDARTVAAEVLNHAITLWDVASGQKLLTLGGHATSVLALAFAPDGKTLASGSMDGTVKLWDVAATSAAPPAPQPVAKLPPGWTEYSPEGGGFAVALPPGKSSDTREVFDTGNTKFRLPGRHTDLPKGGGARVFYGELPPELRALRAEEVLRLLSGARGRKLKDARVTGDVKVQADGHSGRDVAFLVPVGVNGEYVRQRAYVVKDRVYVLTLNGDPTMLPAQDVRTFFDSFRLTAAGPPNR
jgi:hypothetical protein